jgi:hypothetical protein
MVYFLNLRMRRFLSAIFVLLNILFVVTSCGLRYTPPETAEEFQERRHRAIERHFQQELTKDSLEYRSIAFGETTVIKPRSFRVLDSLFEIKYQNEKRDIRDKELENIIQEQQDLVRRDTTLIIYKEHHIFSYPHNDSIQVIESDVQINRELSILNIDILSLALIAKKNDERYKQYLFEESFVYPGTMATEEEELFYRFFKEAHFSAPSYEKDAVLDHILELMEIGYKRKTIRTYDLLVIQARNTLTKQLKALPSEQLSEVFTNVITLENGKEEVQKYWFTYSYVDSSQSRRRQFYFEFDPLLRITKQVEI